MSRPSASLSQGVNRENFAWRQTREVAEGRFRRDEDEKDLRFKMNPPKKEHNPRMGYRSI